MNKIFTIKNTQVHPLGEPRFIKQGKEGVLLIHGYTGYPQEFNFLFDAIAKEGYTVSLPRLPGHGTNRKDFNQTNHQDWLRKVIDEYLALKKICTKVYVAGLSMGGLLAGLIGEIFEPDKLVLMAPAYAISNPYIKLIPIVKWFNPKVKGGWRPEKESDPLRIEHGKEYWEYENPAKIANLLKLQKLATKNLNKITCPTLTIVSRGDKTVPLRAADIIENGISSKVKKRVTLKESVHVVVNGVEREEVAAELIKWFKES